MKGLDDFAIFLQECLYAVTCVDAAKVLDYSDNLKNLVMKLPYTIQERWRNTAYDMKTSRKTITFETLVQFVRKEAKKANDPIYGREVLCSPVTKKPITNVKPKPFGVQRNTFCNTW